MNCSFNIRYKPRTTRAFTKSDLTVYDSADNTALNALTVYGKSEIVDGAIVSAGEGYAVVDLGTLNWTYYDNVKRFVSPDIRTIINLPETDAVEANIICELYDTKPLNYLFQNTSVDKIIASGSTGNISVRNMNYTDAVTFKTAMSGVLLCCQLADPTQGNCIAVKTDNGTGIDGTMAVFETGTPLYGVSDTVRDVMAWDGSAGTVTKVLSEIDLGTLNWSYSAEYLSFSVRITDMATGTYSIAGNILCANYQTKSQAVLDTESTGIAVANNANVIIIKDPAYTDATAFKSAMSGVKLVYELATPTTEQLTSTENASFAALRTFTPQTHAQNNAQAEMTVDYTIRVPTI